ELGEVINISVRQAGVFTQCRKYPVEDRAAFDVPRRCSDHAAVSMTGLGKLLVDNGVQNTLGFVVNLAVDRGGLEFLDRLKPEQLREIVAETVLQKFRGMDQA